ncbi:hypothetical protein VTI74DRAFT_2993 [Chaetomium olivicolor]
MAALPPRAGLDPAPDQKIFNLGVYYSDHYRQAFYAALAAGEVKPLLLPWSFIGSFFLPLLYLSIPHTNRPWLYRMRWAAAAAVVYLNFDLLRTTSAGNEAVAYTTGLIAVWGTIWSLRMLIFTRPQWEAARIERRPKKTLQNGLTKDKETPHTTMLPDESVSPYNEYFWQPFPSHAPFLTRLGWTADLLICFRGAGWNFAIPAIPHPPLLSPSATSALVTIPNPRTKHPPIVHLDAIPLTSRTGASRSRSRTHFLLSRLRQLILSWLVIDLLTITIRQDPYFVLGPDYTSHPFPLPAFLAALPSPRLAIPLLRNISALAGVIAGLHLYASLLQLLLVFPLRKAVGIKAELWQHPTIFGGFAASVLDRGLAGFWGGWWHQTFRAGFVAPARWLFPRQHQRRARAVAEVVLAFVLSGMLHAAGGESAVSETTRAWTPVVFFGAQAVGVLVQTGLCGMPVVKGWTGRMPGWVRRGGNLVFVLVWLQVTGWGLVDDMSRAGLWLFEPVPVSFLRMMGLGLPGDENWWRWGGGEYGLRWYRGRYWWESGIRL